MTCHPKLYGFFIRLRHRHELRIYPTKTVRQIKQRFGQIYVIHFARDYIEVFDTKTKTIDDLRDSNGDTVRNLLDFTEDGCYVAINREEFLQVGPTKTRLVNVETK